jgi:hypothetical protein
MVKVFLPVIFAINLFLIFYFNYHYNINVGSEFDLMLGFLLHSIAFLFSLNLLKYFKLPFVLPFSVLSCVGYSIAPAFTEFGLFQLGEFNPLVLSQMNLGFFIFYLFYFSIVYFKLKPFKPNGNRFFFNLKRIQIFVFLLFLTQLLIVFPVNGLNELIVLYNVGIYLYGYVSNKNGILANVVLFIVIVYQVVSLILGGLIFPLVYFALFVIIVTYVFGGFNRKVALVVVLSTSVFISFSVLFTPVKMQFRQADLGEAGLIGRLDYVVDLIKNGESDASIANTDDYRGPLWRLTYPLSAVSMVQQKSPSLVPFWSGESYASIIYKFIPRLVWRNKPEENSGQEFGHRYQILDASDMRTSMNTPLLAEGYMNYGMMGFYFIFILMAIIMSSFMFSANLVAINEDSLNVVVKNIHICILAIYFTQWESNLSMLLGKIVILKVIEMIINLLYKSKKEVVL